MSNFKSKLESFQNRFKSLLGARAQARASWVGPGAIDWGAGREITSGLHHPTYPSWLAGLRRTKHPGTAVGVGCPRAGGV